MPYTTTAPGLGVIHPTEPGLKVSVQTGWAPDKWEWGIGEPPEYTAPLTSEDRVIIDSRLDSLESGMAEVNIAKVETFESSDSITNAAYLGQNSFNPPVKDNSFYAVYVDSVGVALRQQLWLYAGVGISLSWRTVADSDDLDTAELQDQINILNNDVGILQSNIGNQVEANVTILHQADEEAPAAEVIPTKVAALDPAVYNNGEVVRVRFKRAQCDYTSNGTVWTRVDIMLLTSSGDLPPEWPDDNAVIQGFTVEGFTYYGFLREGGDRSISMLDTANGLANWYLPGQQYGTLYHPGIMHMAEYGSEWQLFEYTGFPIGGGAVGGSFTLTDENATLSQKQADLRNNSVYTERT